MPISYKVHIKKPDGSTGLPLVHDVPADSPDGVDAGPVSSELFDSKPAALAWLLESIRKQELTRQLADYVVQGYDESGAAVEEVDAKDRELAAADARAAVAASPDVTVALHALIASRQLYGFAWTEMERTLAGLELGEDKHKPHPLTLEVLSQAATRKAAEAFDSADLFARLGGNIFPWMQQTIKANVLADEKDKKLADEESEQRRRASRIPIGVKVDPEDQGLLDRSRPLVLIGYGPAVRIVLDTIVTSVLAARDPEHPDKLFTVVRLDAGHEVKPSLDFLLRLPELVWLDCARNRSRLTDFLVKQVAPRLNRSPDLLVVDDLALTRASEAVVARGASAGGYAPYRLGDAAKCLLDWLDRDGVAMVAGVPTATEKVIDCGEPALESLRMRCTARPVTVRRQADNLEPGRVRLLVGKNAWYVDVDETLLQPAATPAPQLIT